MHAGASAFACSCSPGKGAEKSIGIHGGFVRSVRAKSLNSSTRGPDGLEGGTERDHTDSARGRENAD